MTSALEHSSFHELFFPDTEPEQGQQMLSLRRAVRFFAEGARPVREYPFVVFDLETTGLDSTYDRVIEIGAQRVIGGNVVGEFSALIDCEVPISNIITRITGISADMLRGQPKISQVLPLFLKFIEGAILVAHNAVFDMGFVRAECDRQSIDWEWSSFCTLKMARDLLPDLERKNLDTLAEHYGLTFESRHRSIGDVKVTEAVLQKLLGHERFSPETTWGELEEYSIPV